MKSNPHLYEASARLFIRRLSERYGRTVTLDSVPEEEWETLKDRGFDLLWLMGVWRRSAAARSEALVNTGLRREYGEALPGWKEEDIAGSPYAIYGYEIDSYLGTAGDLARLKSRLNSLGIGLIVDFVPNHLASDHPWTLSHPQRFVTGRGAVLERHPEWFFRAAGGAWLAHGRDPNFPPWTDTAQMNFFSDDLRQALIRELLRIAEIADGVRCDMAMLTLNSIFEIVWGEMVRDYSVPKTEFWVETIDRVKQRYPHFLFLSEAYWGYERKLQECGFDFTYDKALYDRLRYSAASDVRQHLASDEGYLKRSVHFIENHDEARAATAFGRERSMAAAIIIATTPGMRLFHDGQLEGKRLRLPVQLTRAPEETADPEIIRFYDRLLKISGSEIFHEGKWKLFEIASAWPGNESHQNLLGWSWIHGDQIKTVVVNYSPHQAQGWLKLPRAWNGGKSVFFLDELTGLVHDRNPLELNQKGLYADLAPWQSHIMSAALY
ncbi:MAG: alpha-amylase [Chloroflexi bacterium]|nr:alpha-amylase [Chloroflexota bacterium]